MQTHPARPSPPAPQVARAIRSARRRSLPAKALATVLNLATLPLYLHLSGSPLAAGLAVVIQLLLSARALSFGTERTLRSLPEAPADLADRVRSLAAAAGLAPPHVRLATVPRETDAEAGPRSAKERLRSLAFSANACAANDLTPGTTVLVGQNLLASLHEDEEEAVLAHEVAHLAHGSPLLSVLHVLSVAATKAAARATFLFAVLFALFTDSPYGVWTTLCLLFLVSTARSVANGLASQVEEHAADRTGSTITARPDLLASALVRIHAASIELKALVKTSRSTPQSLQDLIKASPAYQEPALPLSREEIALRLSEGPFRKTPSALTRLSQTHPLTSDRVNRLLSTRSS